MAQPHARRRACAWDAGRHARLPRQQEARHFLCLWQPCQEGAGGGGASPGAELRDKEDPQLVNSGPRAQAEQSLGRAPFYSCGGLSNCDAKLEMGVSCSPGSSLAVETQDPSQSKWLSPCRLPGCPGVDQVGRPLSGLAAPRVLPMLPMQLGSAPLIPCVDTWGWGPRVDGAAGPRTGGVAGMSSSVTS